MFMGSVRRDYKSAERLALASVKTREMSLLEQLEEERNPNQQVGEEKTIVQHGPLPYNSDSRLQILMEESVSFLKNIHGQLFLTPWRFLIWKGT